MCPVSRVNLSFSRVNSRKRRVQGAAGHSLRHTLLTLAFRVLFASLNLLLGALREQPQLRKSCFAGKLFIFEGYDPQKTRKSRSRAQSPAQPQHIGLHGLDCISEYVAGSPARPAAAVGELFSKNVRAQEALERYSPPKRRKKPKVRARIARLGFKRGCHGAGWCLPVRRRSLESSAAKFLKRGGACEMGRRAYAPPNAPGATLPRVYVRWLPCALVPPPCAPTL